VAGDNRTEKATPKRRDEARKKGQVARSVDLNGSVVLLAAVATLALTGPALLGRLKEVVASGLARSGSPDLATAEAIGALAKWVGIAMLQTVGPVAGVAALAAFLANVAQVRLKLTPKAAAPSMRGINPMQGFKRVFGPQGLFEGTKAIVKTAVIGVVAFLAVWPSIPELGTLVGLPPGALLHKLAGEILAIALRVGGTFLIVAIVDYIWQRRRHERSLRMTKDEVRREARQQDLSPEVRGAMRRRQREQARKRMLADVPTADVVVTNPTHYAVALRYDGTSPAPQVVAKGADLVAAAIRRVAQENEVPILHNAPLARALHAQVEIGHMIPEEFYAAVAEVLAFVYRTAGKARRRRQRPRAALQPAG
jgi:flagellar biosynthetic protein FlhB